MLMFNKLGIAAPRWWRRIGAVVGMSLALVVVVATGASAHATTVTTLTDDFEAVDANSVWKAQVYPGGGWHCCYVGENPTAHSPSHSGYVEPAYDSFTFLGRSVHLPALLDPTTRCQASIWMFPISGTSPTVSVEVIDPRDGTYISVKTVTLAADSGWTWQPAPVWKPATLDVYFRVSNIGTGTYDQLWIDDLKVTCLSSV